MSSLMMSWVWLSLALVELAVVPAGNEQELMDSVNKQSVLYHTEVLQLDKQPPFIKQIILTTPVTFCTSVWLLQMQHEMPIL